MNSDEPKHALITVWIQCQFDKIFYGRDTVKLGDKKRFDKEQIGVKEPFLVTNCQLTA